MTQRIAIILAAIVGLALVLTGMASAQSTSLTAAQRSMAKTAMVEQFVQFNLGKNDAPAVFDVQVPVRGLFYLDLENKAARASEVKYYDSSGRLLGAGGVRVERAGKILVRVAWLRRHGKDKKIHIQGQFVLLETDPDRFEPNDQPGQARVLEIGPENPIAGGPVMLVPRGDIDWFRLKVTAPGLITPRIAVPSDNLFNVRLSDHNNRTMPWNRAIRVMPGEYRWRISGGSYGVDMFQVSFDFAAAWDDCRPNLQRAHACALAMGKATGFTLRPDPAYAQGTTRSQEKWFSLTVGESGYVVLSLGGLPKPQYDSNNKQISGLKLLASVYRMDGRKSSTTAAHITHGSVIFRAETPGEYQIGLRGTWLKSNPLRVLKITPQFKRHISTTLKDADFAIIGMSLDDRIGRTSLGLAMLAGAGGGYYTNAFKAGKIKSVVKEFIGGVERQPAMAQPETPMRPDKPVNARPNSPPGPAPEPTAEQLELSRLIGLRKYLAAGRARFLYRHHFKTPAGVVVKRLDKTNAAEASKPGHVLVRSQQLSPVISRRLLDRVIQSLE